MSVEAMYQEIILDHYRERHHYGLREPFTAQVHHVNPSCGDEVTLRAQVVDEMIIDVSYEAVGCAISQAATSVMTDLTIGHPVAAAWESYELFRSLMHGRGELKLDADSEERLDDAIAFAGVAKFPARVKCALLGWAALADAITRSEATSEEMR